MKKEETIIIEILLDKFIKSKPFVTGEERKRAVILKFDKTNFPQYDYEDYDIKEKYYNAVKYLEQLNLVSVKYRKGVVHFIEEVRLNIDNVDESYKFIGKDPLIDKIEKLKLRLKKSLSICKIDWLKSFFEFDLDKLCEKNKLVGLWKKDINYLEEVFIALDCLSETVLAPITQRVFSIRCYHNSKYFERVIQKDIVNIIRTNEPTISDMLETEIELSDRVILAQVGIILRAEVFEFCGNISMETNLGKCDFSVFKNGACIRSEIVGELRKINFAKAINRVVFIENKTNYNEYILKLKNDNELVIFHGGFFSPQKADFFKLLNQNKPEDVICVFWADIDYGGFKMFARLKEIFNGLQPMCMDKDSYCNYKQYGLSHSDKYFENLSKLLNDKNFEIFYEVIYEILENKKTIEQEIMLYY